ncbi:hypothetical protein EAG_15273 [Camponotus floridanus]|uniref:EB domain-containing protein n=1 Tax=Camponotus floridanus TaxID=104421 RepID=E2AM60_CAMFO|nr:hypothetical protein EAG_15273 [Camponotus floridanus]
MNVHIGDNCERDAECIKNAFCRWQQNCLCNPYYSPSPDKSLCIATVGLSCEDHTTCQTMANGECRQGTCSCKDEFFLDSTNSSNCIPSLYTFCNSDYECYEDDKSPDILECKNGQCVCKEGEPLCAKGSLFMATGTIVTISLLIQRMAQ